MELTQGMQSKPVEYFFAHWRCDDKKKESFREWVQSLVENQPVTMEHIAGYSLEHVSPFVEKAVRTCIVPLLSMRESITVDFNEIPEGEGYNLQIKIQEKNSGIDDFLSGF